MKLIFFGTPDYVIPVLDALNKKFKEKNNSPIVAVVTQKPKPAGRKQFLTYSAVDSWAHKRAIPIFFEPEEIIKNNIQADLGILASYSKIIPKKVIEAFPKGILNIHPSLLPEFRGASPVAAAIASGQTQTGVSIIKLDEKLDHGPIISQFKEEILDSDTSETLRNRLFELSAEVLITLLPAYIQGKITPKVQDDSKATFTREIKKEDGFIPPVVFKNIVFSDQIGIQPLKTMEIKFIKDCTIHPSPITIHNFIRALSPWPGVWTEIRIKYQESSIKKRLKILKAHLEPARQDSSIDHQSSIINHQSLIIDSVQLEGKNPVPWKQFCEGYPKVTFSN